MKKKSWKGLIALTGVTFLIVLLAGYAPSAPPTSPGLTPEKGGVLKITQSGGPPVLNPMADYTVRVITYTAPVFNGLVMIDPTQEEVSVEKVVPSLAEKWTISPDAKIYTFYLRKG